MGLGVLQPKKMKKLGIFKGSDLKKWPLEHLIDTFGKSGKFYYHIVRGIDNRKVKPSRERKSIGAERTFSKDIADVGTMKQHLNKIAEILWNRITNAKKYGKTLTVKVKLHNFESHTKSKTFERRIINYNILLQESFHLLDELEPQKFNVRLLGISVSNFSEEEDDPQNSQEQLKLF